MVATWTASLQKDLLGSVLLQSFLACAEVAWQSIQKVILGAKYKADTMDRLCKMMMFSSYGVSQD